MGVKSLSVFFPAYNEEQNIAVTVTKAVAFLKTLKIPWEIIVVNDGSKDRTAEVVSELIKKNPALRLVSQENGGYGKALRAGFENAKFEWVTYTDSDGQFDFSEAQKLMDLADTCDAVWGFRIKRRDNLKRNILARIWGLSVRLLFGLQLRDTDCGFKLIRMSAIKKVLPLVSTRGAMINAELAIKLKRAGFKIGEVGVNHFPRSAGQQGGASLPVAVKSYLELFKLWVFFLSH
jgi:glycosyltransferase involved in cell wall biosynthesis